MKSAGQEYQEDINIGRVCLASMQEEVVARWSTLIHPHQLYSWSKLAYTHVRDTLLSISYRGAVPTYRPRCLAAKSRRQVLLSCRRRNKILRESNFAEKSKFSLGVIASAPFPPTAAALHAVRAREEKEKRSEVRKRAHLEGGTQGALQGEIPQFGLCRWRMGGGSWLRLKIRA